MASYHSAKGSVGYTVVGTPTIVNGIVSGFSTGNYVKPASVVNFSNASSWEFVSRFKVEANTTGSHFLADFAADAKGFDIDVTSTSLFWELGNASASNWQYSKTISYTFDPTIFYSVKLSFDGNLYSIWLKTDTTQWTKLDEYASTTSVGSSYLNAFGYSIRFNGRVFKGSIDLNNTYIKVNGQAWFGICPVEVKHIKRYGNTVNLPAGYTQLDYISTIDGPGPYIDTGLVVGSNTRVLAQYKLHILSFSSPISVRDVTSAGAGFGIGVNGSQQFISDYNGDRKTFTITPNTTDIITVDKNKNVCTITIGGQSETVTNTVSTFITTNTLPFFAQNSADTVSALRYTFYSFKMWNNNTLVRDFVPAKNSSNVLGMYDLVSGQFFTNAGTGSFTAGPSLQQNVNYLIRKENNTEKLVFADHGLYLTGPVNYEVMGTTTIVDNIASGFNGTNRLKFLEVFPDFNNKDLECLFKLKNIGGGGLGQRTVFLLSANTGVSIANGGSPGIMIRTKRSDESSYSNRAVYDFNIVFNNTSEAWFLLKKIGKVFSLQISYDGTTYRNSATYTLQEGEEVYIASYTQDIMGSSSWANTSAELDLNQSYIKIDGSLWFYGKNYASQNIAPVPANYTYGTTTTSAIGYVDMRTQAFTAAPSGATIGRDE